MHDTLMRVMTRGIRRVTVGSALGVLAATTAVVSDRTSGPNLDEAAHAAERAQLLVRAAECGVPEAKSTETCQRYLKRASDLLVRVRQELVPPDRIRPFVLSQP